MGDGLTANPVVLFVDDYGWTSFDQVAAALHRRGVRTVRVVLNDLPALVPFSAAAYLRRLATRLFYSETIVLGRAAGQRRLEALLADGSIVDVMSNEPTLMKLGLASDIGRRLTRLALAFGATPPDTLLDKYKVNECLASSGVQVPGQIRASDLSPAEAAARLGLPLFVKAMIGAGGEQVRLAGAIEAIEEAVRDLGGDPATLFYQEAVIGQMALYTCVMGADGPLMHHGFIVDRAQYDLGPSAVLHLWDDPALLAAGKAAAQAFGCRGFLSFGFIHTPDGRLLHVDANSRICGMICAPLTLGIDFIAPYLAMVKGQPWKEVDRRPDPAVALPVFPFALMRAAESGSAEEITAAILRLLSDYRPVLGLRYFAYLLLAVGFSLGARLRRGVRRVWRTGSRAHAPSVIEEGCAVAVEAPVKAKPTVPAH